MSNIVTGIPLVYSCSGCSNVAQAANALALRLDRMGLAEMSCIAGVGAGVPALVRMARSGRNILALDGCGLGCCREALAVQGVRANVYLDFSRMGLRKLKGKELSPGDLEHLWEESVLPVARELKQGCLPETP